MFFNPPIQFWEQDFRPSPSTGCKFFPGFEGSLNPKGLQALPSSIQDAQTQGKLLEKKPQMKFEGHMGLGFRFFNFRVG